MIYTLMVGRLSRPRSPQARHTRARRLWRCAKWRVFLFNLFAHDMFGSLAERLNGCTNMQLSAFQFADDTAPIAAAKTAQDAAKKMRTILNQLDTWAPANLMSWGPGSKLMVYSQTAVNVTTLGPFQLGGHALEFTDKQVYLGLEFTNDLAKSQHHMAMDRAGTARRRLDALSPCMANTAIPLVHRQPLLRSVYFPALMYGCEVWGNVDRREPEWSPERLKPIHDALAGAYAPNHRLPARQDQAPDAQLLPTSGRRRARSQGPGLALGLLLRPRHGRASDDQVQP